MKFIITTSRIWTLLIIGIALYLTRVMFYGLDCGLLSVWFGYMDYKPIAHIMDFLSGYTFWTGITWWFLKRKHDRMIIMAQESGLTTLLQFCMLPYHERNNYKDYNHWLSSWR